MSEAQNIALQKATYLVNAGNYNEALEQARAVLTTNPNNGDAKLIEAISLSQLGNSRDATEAFAAAIQLDPTNAKARFNAAVHEFNTGNVGQARFLAKEALDIEPRHQGVWELLERMGPEKAPNTDNATYQRVDSSDFAPAYEGIEFIRKNPKMWTAVGWLISAASLFCFIFFWVTLGPHLGEIIDVGKANDPAKTMALQKSLGGSPLLSFGIYGLVALNLTWVIMDLIHRKGNFIWLIAHIPATCACMCIGGNFLTLPVYMLFGRK